MCTFSFYPDYYPDFSCLADNCPETCCQGWLIEIDNETLQKWNDLPGQIQYVSHYKKGNIGEKIHICMNEKMVCPMLDEHGLCSLVCTHTDAMIPKTCREFPRVKTVLETTMHKTLTLRCAPVLDLLWKKNTFRYSCRSNFSDCSDCPFPSKNLLDGFLAIGNEYLKSDDGDGVPKLRNNTSGDFLFRIFDALYQTHKKLEACIPLDKNGYKTYGMEYFTQENLDAVLSYFRENARQAHVCSLNNLQHAEAPDKTIDDFLHLNDIQMHRIFSSFLNNPVYGKDFASDLSCSEALMNVMNTVLLQSRSCKDHEQIMREQLRPAFSPEIERKLMLLILEELFSSVFSPEIEEYESALVRLQWLVVQISLIRYLLYLDLYAKSMGTADTSDPIASESNGNIKIRISRLFRITDHPDIMKISFFDENFINWLWTPEEVKKLLGLW